MTLPDTPQDTESEQRSHETCRLIVYLSMVVEVETEMANSKEKNGVAATDQNVTSSDTGTLVEKVKSVLEDCTRQLYNELRRKRLESIKSCQECIRGDIVDGGSLPKETTCPTITYAREPCDTFSIETRDHGSLFVDITSLSVLSSLVSSGDCMLSGNSQRHVRARASSCCRDEESEESCPLKSLAASRPEWWDRPLWAWSWKEIILAHGAMIAQTVMDALEDEMKWNIVVATDKSLAQLPFMHWKRTGQRHQLMPIVIDSTADSSVVRRIVEDVDYRSMSDTDLKDAYLQLLERYGRDRMQLTDKVYQDEISQLIQSVQVETSQVNSPDFDESGSLTTTPLKNPKQVEEKSETAKVEVTPETKRCTQVIAVHASQERAELERDNNVVFMQRAISSSTAEIKADQGPTSPQFDSTGIDITMLSQLPASIRSEARIAAALSENASVARRKRGPLATWISHVQSQGKRESNTVSKKATWTNLGDVDPDTLNELPSDIQAMIQSELSQGSRPSKRKRPGIASFFHARSTGKRSKCLER